VRNGFLGIGKKPCCRCRGQQLSDVIDRDLGGFALHDFGSVRRGPRTEASRKYSGFGIFPDMVPPGHFHVLQPWQCKDNSLESPLRDKNPFDWCTVADCGAGAVGRRRPLAGLPAGGRGRPLRSRGTAPPSRCESDYLSQVDIPLQQFETFRDQSSARISPGEGSSISACPTQPVDDFLGCRPEPPPTIPQYIEGLFSRLYAQS